MKPSRQPSEVPSLAGLQSERKGEIRPDDLTQDMGPIFDEANEMYMGAPGRAGEPDNVLEMVWAAPQTAVEDIGTAGRYAAYQALVRRAADVFGDRILASKWLSTPNSKTDGQTPLEFVRQHDYAGVLLEPIFIRIEHGIYG